MVSVLENESFSYITFILKNIVKSKLHQLDHVFNRLDHLIIEGKYPIS